MKHIGTWLAADEIVSPLGLTSEENYKAVRNCQTGIKLMHDSGYSNEAVYLGSMDRIPGGSDSGLNTFTRFEHLVITSITGALKKTALDPSSPRVIFILSTTKGNIDLIEQGKQRDHNIHLPATARKISHSFGNPNTPIVISNACVSGVTALLTAKRLLDKGLFDHAIVTGADVLSRFIISGFQSLSALSAGPCRPFDKRRNGTTLGEAAATMILTNDPGVADSGSKIKILGGGLSNDANHISGPSRTGVELAEAIRRALADAEIVNEQIDFISAHGTATIYNDEMEAKAFNLAGIQGTPLNSLKGNFGHTLGAAGLLETVISAHSLFNNEMMPTYGFNEPGVSVPVNVIENLVSKQITTCLKTASGFGGCNAALVLQKN